MSFKSLLAYQKGFELAMEVYELSKTFPKSELFGLTSQMVRSSRSVCSNIAEGYRKRQYEKILPIELFFKKNHNYLTKATD